MSLRSTSRRPRHCWPRPAPKTSTLTLTIPNFYSTTIPQILVSNLDEVGITLEVDSVDFPAWLNDVYTNHDYELSFVLHTEARDFENWANPDYYFTYDNPDVQELYAQSLAATDEAEAAELLDEAARIVSEDAGGRLALQRGIGRRGGQPSRGCPRST